jgi:hypothetical protein
MFVDSASFILRAAVGGKAGKKDAGRTGVSKGEPLWDLKQLHIGNILSCISYLKVEKIEGPKITVTNHLGGSWIMSKDLLERDSWSADHFDKEIKCNMTDLALVLQSCNDTIFTVKFSKQVDPKEVEERLAGLTVAQLKSDKTQKDLSKEFLNGSDCTITGHLIECENHFGRSLIVDLNANGKNNIRSVDHRSIDWIIFRNIKYSMGKKQADLEELPIKP